MHGWIRCGRSEIPMIRRYNLSHPVGQPMPEDWLDLPDSVVAAADYDAISARLADAERIIAMALIAIKTGMPEYNRVDVVYILTGDVSAPACNHFPGQSKCVWCSGAAERLRYDNIFEAIADTPEEAVTMKDEADRMLRDRDTHDSYCAAFDGQDCTCGNAPAEWPYARVMCREDLPVSAEAGIVADLYNELLYAVASKYPGESRHDTALRYIRDRETRPSNGPSQAVEPKP
jgi:hypothetical protein